MHCGSDANAARVNGGGDPCINSSSIDRYQTGRQRSPACNLVGACQPRRGHQLDSSRSTAGDLSGWPEPVLHFQPGRGQPRRL